jgi:DNA repair protein RecO (recombination protein O)
MSDFSTSAIMLRRIDYGDYDLIVTLMTEDYGKISLIAKNAKKSIKRFSGALELFSVMNITGKKGRSGLPVLKEVDLFQPFLKIRSDIAKTAYASYFAEVIVSWVEEGKPQKDLYILLKHVFDLLNRGRLSGEASSILFQMRFLDFSGLSPNLTECGNCRTGIETFEGGRIYISYSKGGILCRNCRSHRSGNLELSKGTLKQLMWVNSGDLKKAERIKFTSRAVFEGLDFIEKFVSFHLGREPNSLNFLRQIRKT